MVNEVENPRELDALIAEKVMGLSEVEFVGERLQYLNDAMSVELGGRWSSPVEHYSSSIAAAFSVVEKMREKGWTFTATNDFEVTEYLPWQAEFHRRVGRAVENHPCEADFLPEAICLAALQAVEEK